MRKILTLLLCVLSSVSAQAQSIGPNSGNNGNFFNSPTLVNPFFNSFSTTIPPLHEAVGGQMYQNSGDFTIGSDVVQVLTGDQSLYTKISFTGTPTTGESPGFLFPISGTVYTITSPSTTGQTLANFALALCRVLQPDSVNPLQATIANLPAGVLRDLASFSAPALALDNNGYLPVETGCAAQSNIGGGGSITLDQPYGSWGTFSNFLVTAIGTPTVTVNLTGSNAVVGQYVWFNGAPTVGGLTISGVYTVTSVNNANSFTITAGGNASSTATGGSSVTVTLGIAPITTAHVTASVYGAFSGSGAPKYDGGPVSQLVRTYGYGYVAGIGDQGPLLNFLISNLNVGTFATGGVTQTGYLQELVSSNSQNSVSLRIGTMHNSLTVDRLVIDAGVYATDAQGGTGDCPGDKGWGSISACQFQSQSFVLSGTGGRGTPQAGAWFLNSSAQMQINNEANGFYFSKSDNSAIQFSVTDAGVFAINNQLIVGTSSSVIPGVAVFHPLTNYNMSMNAIAGSFQLNFQNDSAGANVPGTIISSAFTLKDSGNTVFATDGNGTLGMTGVLVTAASTTAGAGFYIPQGVAPTSPINGQIWMTAAGLYYRFNGTTHGPL